MLINLIIDYDNRNVHEGEEISEVINSCFTILDNEWDENLFEKLSYFILKHSDGAKTYFGKFGVKTLPFLNTFIYNFIGTSESSVDGCADLVINFSEAMETFVGEMTLTDFDLFLDICYRMKRYTSGSFSFSFEVLVDFINKAISNEIADNKLFVIIFLTSLFIYDNSLIAGFGECIQFIFISVNINESDEETIAALLDFFNVILFNDDGSIFDDELMKLFVKYLSSSNNMEVLFTEEILTNYSVLESFVNFFKRLILNEKARATLDRFCSIALTYMIGVVNNSDSSELVLIIETLLIGKCCCDLNIDNGVLVESCNYIQSNPYSFSNEMLILSYALLPTLSQ